MSENRHTDGMVQFLVVLAIQCTIIADHLNAEEPGARVLARPVAMAISGDRSEVFIANQGMSAITAVDCVSMDVRMIRGNWSRIVDIATIPNSNGLLAVSADPPSIFWINTENGTAFSEPVPLELCANPARVVVSLEKQFICVSMTWDYSVSILPMAIDGNLQKGGWKQVALEFPPKELLALPEGRFLVADAFGGRIAVIDAGSGVVVAAHEMHCHHIGGMARDDLEQRVLITHQRLSRIAETSRDDIHWGTLMQNAVAVVPEAALMDSAQPVGRSLQIRQLGDVGNGAADPAGVAAWERGSFAVAIAGTNQVAVWKSTARVPMFVDVGLMPTRLVHIQPGKLLCINTLEDTASLVDCGNGIRVERVIGAPRTLATAEERGEAAFFSGGLSHDGWMSCSSCHVNGHSPDLLADTLGDGRFGNPKRIPSLLNSFVTGPWGWGGSKPALDLQIRQTLETTMHRDLGSRSAGSSDDETAADIAAYLRTLEPPPTSIDAASPGADVFRKRGCAKCHDPNSHFTSTQTYDVGVRDELGMNLFNPPSLRGLRHRRTYFHDSRYRSVDELLRNHPAAETDFSSDEMANLKAFLMML